MNNAEWKPPKLRPCPFCGSQPDTSSHRGTVNTPATFTIRCRGKDCPVRPATIWRTPEVAAIKWNTRVLAAWWRPPPVFVELKLADKGVDGDTVSVNAYAVEAIVDGAWSADYCWVRAGGQDYRITGKRQDVQAAILALTEPTE